MLRVYQDRAALMWETEAEGPCKVYWGAEGALDVCAESTEEEISSGDGQPPVVRTTAHIHKAWIEGLKPGRTYAYRIAGPNLRSETYQFRTIPARTDEVRFVVYGDTRTNIQVHRRLVEQILKHDLDFVVHVGDLVSRGDEYRQWGPQFFEPMRGLAERVPVYITKGNHEGRNGTYERLLLPPGEDGDFGFDYGPLHYFGIDNVSGRADGDDLAQRIARDAQASKATWKFVSYHVPSVNFGGHWSSWQQSQALPAFAEAGIDFAITGHSHQYERFRPVEVPGQGQHVTYLTAGGGGAPLYPIEPTAYHACAKSVYQFCLFHIKGDTLTMDTIDVDGRVIDHVTITKKGGQVDEQYLRSAVPMAGIQLHSLLYERLGAALRKAPEKGRPFTLKVDVVPPALPADAKLTFKLRGDADAYELPPAHLATVSREGGVVRAEFSVTPVVSIRLPGGTRSKAVPIEPALSLDCHYELDSIRETISRPVTAMGN